jgi:hypothetical protein
MVRFVCHMDVSGLIDEALARVREVVAS